MCAVLRFLFQTGSIKRKIELTAYAVEAASFYSRLVRLKGFMKIVSILYAILVLRVKPIFRIAIFGIMLPSTFGCANSLEG